jgi:hypothetical protein
MRLELAIVGIAFLVSRRLCCALAIREGTHPWHPDALFEIDDILPVCGELVVLDY